MQRAFRSNGAFSRELRSGLLFWMPAGATWLNRDKPRPFVLATRCGPDAFGTLVYGSTRQTEKHAGAACIQVLPVREGLNRNGLREKTYFYPGTLFPVEHADLPPQAGFLGTALGELRAALRTALGISQGSCLCVGAPRGSRRGRIVELSAGMAREIRTEYAVILTEPRYSREENYQIILPVYPGVDGVREEHQVVIPAARWPAGFFGLHERVLLPIPAVHSVWYADDIICETEHVLDEDTLALIDRALCRFFSLPEPDETR